MTDVKGWFRRKLPLLFDRENIMETLEIPIFPLNTVLFPAGRLPLRVFEQRYMDMAKTCLRDDQPFGICLIKEGQEVGAPAVPEQVGCLAKVINWEMPQLGILSLDTLGLQRFAIEEHRIQENGLIVAKVVSVSLEASQPLPDTLLACARVLRSIIEKAGEAHFQAPLQFDDAVWVGYRLVEVLPLKSIVKQKMLEMNDPIARLQILQTFLVKQGLTA